jgi:hypothetical protein
MSNCEQPHPEKAPASGTFSGLSGSELDSRIANITESTTKALEALEQKEPYIRAARWHLWNIEAEIKAIRGNTPNDQDHQQPEAAR